MDVIIRKKSLLSGRLTVPPDKSICHRSLLVAAIARGHTEIHPWPEAEDCQRTLEVIERLGVQVAKRSGSVVVEGRGANGLYAPPSELYCGESGTTFRLLAGLLAGQPFAARLCAAPSLNRRPMRRIVEPLMEMGARFEVPGSTAASPEWYPPMTVHGRRPLKAISYHPQVASAQVKSAILLAGLSADGRTTVIEVQETRDHTERMLRHFSASVGQRGLEVWVEPSQLVSPGSLSLPGDFSSAAFFLVGAVCSSGSQVIVDEVSLNPTRSQLIDLLKRMGAHIEITVEESSWEPRGQVTVHQVQPLRGLTLEAHEVPAIIDELPILMVAACCAEGVTRLHGLAELRVKETDRIRSMVNGLNRLGARIRLVGSDTVEIIGGPLSGAEVESAGDHRTAMSLVIAGLMAEGTTIVHGAECVAKSFPEFFDRLGLLITTASVEVPGS